MRTGPGIFSNCEPPPIPVLVPPALEALEAVKRRQSEPVSVPTAGELTAVKLSLDNIEIRRLQRRQRQIREALKAR